MGKIIVITGGCGFIGRHVAKYIVETCAEDDQIIVFDNLESHGMNHAVEELISHEKVQFVNIDLSDKEAIRQQSFEVDRLYHLAAIVGVQKVTDNPERVLCANTMSTMYVFDWFLKNKAENARLLFSSSSEVYSGNILAAFPCPVPTPEDVPIVISDIKDARFSYAISKLWGEAYLHYLAQKHSGVSFVAVRYHNVYGPDMGYQHVIPQIIKRITERETPFRIIGKDQTRSFCWVEDAAESTVRVLESDNFCRSHIVHIGDAQGELGIEELYNTLFSLCKWAPSEVVYIDSPPGSVKRRCPDTTLLKEIIGDLPKTLLVEGLKKTIPSYVKRECNEINS